MARSVIWIMVLCMFVAAACSREPAIDVAAEPPVVTSEPSAETSPATTVAAFDCDDGSYVVVEFREDSDDVALFLPGETVFLPHVEAASGAKYADDGVIFWSKGQEAMLKLGGVTVSCVKNGPASVIERAKLGGADFWATGNEPGWTLELFPDHLVLVTNYGEMRIEAPLGEPIVDQAARSTVFQAVSDDHEIEVVLQAQRCADDMSGHRFQTTVELVLDGRSYRGCGQALH